MAGFSEACLFCFHTGNVEMYVEKNNELLQKISVTHLKDVRRYLNQLMQVSKNFLTASLANGM